jgi:E3 ubiquitin-protein ligase UBR7
MGSTPCSVRKTSLQQPVKGNLYNHNFEGRFCTCDKEYDVNAEEGTMFQCLVCEDWFHEKCIGEGRVPDQDEFDGFVCQGCVGKNDWLGRYVAVKDGFMSTLETYPEINVDIETTVDDDGLVTQEMIPLSSASTVAETAPPEPTTATETESGTPTTGLKRSLSTEPESPEQASKRVKLETVVDTDTVTEQCKWSSLPIPPETPFALFLKEDFRDHLCRCLSCQTLRLRNLPMIAGEEETYEPDEDNSDTGTPPLPRIPRIVIPFATLPRTLHFADFVYRFVTRRRNKSPGIPP